jgi:HD superfamily phosphohydrolase
MIHRDQIHGDVRFDPLAVALLNTGSLQRLGRVYQLGYAHLVYRGGTHTRLSHAMGASHVAGWLVDQLRQNYLQAGELPRGAVEVERFFSLGRAQASRLLGGSTT